MSDKTIAKRATKESQTLDAHFSVIAAEVKQVIEDAGPEVLVALWLWFGHAIERRERNDQHPVDELAQESFLLAVGDFSPKEPP